MSFPQPDPDQYVLKLYPFWNLSTPLQCPGDIYQSTQGSLAFCVGPDSDIANVAFCYYDDQAPNFMRFATISPSRSFTSLIAARNEQEYLPAHRPGRIMFWSNDIYDPNFRPPGFNSVSDDIQFIPPVLNVIQYFQPAISLVPQRNDKEYLFQAYRHSGGGTEYLVIPSYGRRYCYVNFTNGNPTSPTTFGILGVNYAITQDSGPVTYHQVTTLHAPAAVAPAGGTVSFIFTAATTGMFDALVFSITDGGPAPLRIVMSDQDQR